MAHPHQTAGTRKVPDQMPYLIDGHNLIPKIAGLSLDEIDDEDRLVEMLQVFCRRQRKQAEVYFDNAQPGMPRARGFGLVTAYYVRQGNTADREIDKKLRRLGGEARNYTVVSSDRAVQSSTRAVRAHTLTSEDFAKRLVEILVSQDSDKSDALDTALSEDEIDDWLQVFGEGGDLNG